MVRNLLIAPIRWYQRWVSPVLGRHCRFEPSCSHYAIEAIRIHGPLKGVGLAVWRLLRCQPLCRGGYDPPPPAKHRVVPPSQTAERPLPATIQPEQRDGRNSHC